MVMSPPRFTGPRNPRVTLESDLMPYDAPQRMPTYPTKAPSQILRGDFRPSGAPTFDSHHYANLIDLSTPVDIVSNIFLTQPPTKRNFLLLRNASGAATIFIGFGNNASLLSTMRLTPGTIVLFDDVVPQNDLYAIADMAGAILAYSYSNIAD